MISVVMSVYNGEAFIRPTIESILSQTHQDYEFIIVNDGSIDSTLEIIKEYALLDSRIKIITRENKGLIYSLNEAIEYSKGEYIARMDADDICEINRLELQRIFLDENEFIDVVGADVFIFSEKSRSTLKMPRKNSQLESTMLFSAPFIHPTVMIRRRCIKSFGFDVYKEAFKGAEDYELWIRLFNGSNFANIPAYLLSYRQHSNSVTQLENKALDDRCRVHSLIYKSYFKKFLNWEINENQAQMMFALSQADRFKHYSYSIHEIFSFSMLFIFRCLQRMKVNILFRFVFRLASLIIRSK